MKLGDVWFSAIAEAENNDHMIIVSGVARGAGFFGRTAVSTMMIRYVTLILLRLWDMSMR
jgi:hypothetical protein